MGVLLTMLVLEGCSAPKKQKKPPVLKEEARKIIDMLPDQATQAPKEEEHMSVDTLPDQATQAPKEEEYMSVDTLPDQATPTPKEEAYEALDRKNGSRPTSQEMQEEMKQLVDTLSDEVAKNLVLSACYRRRHSPPALKEEACKIVAMLSDEETKELVRAAWESQNVNAKEKRNAMKQFAAKLSDEVTKSLAQKACWNSPPTRKEEAREIVAMLSDDKETQVLKEEAHEIVNMLSDEAAKKYALNLVQGKHEPLPKNLPIQQYKPILKKQWEHQIDKFSRMNLEQLTDVKESAEKSRKDLELLQTRNPDQAQQNFVRECISFFDFLLKCIENFTNNLAN